MRDLKFLEAFARNAAKKMQQMMLFRNLKKEVNYGANGTQDYVFKNGVNKDKTSKQIKEHK